MFNRLTAQILAWKSNCRGRKTGVPGEKPSESDWDRQISAHVRTRSWGVEVGGTTDDHYANLTPHNCQVYTLNIDMAGSSSGSVACSDKWICTETSTLYNCENRFFEDSFHVDLILFSWKQSSVNTTEVLSNREVFMRRLYVIKIDLSSLTPPAVMSLWIMNVHYDVCLWNIYSCCLIPNCTPNHMITSS